MKLLSAKIGLHVLLAGIFLFGLTVLTATSAGAQDINNWKLSDQAQAELGVEVKNLHSQIPTLSGTPLNNAKAKLYYYKELIGTIQGGTPVSVAVPVSLHIFDNPAKDKDTMLYTDVVVDSALRTSLLTDATVLLKL